MATSHKKNKIHIFGIRREDKNRWERRTPLIPENIEELRQKHDLLCVVQPSPIRAFSDNEYRDAGAEVQEDLSGCSIIFAVKEIPIDFFQKGKTYVFFSHTIKGQSSNIPMLKRILDLDCTLIDYEKITDERGRRIIFFGRYAGLAGMIDTFWAIGRRLKWQGIDNPFTQIEQAYRYKILTEAKEAVRRVGEIIKKDGLPGVLLPFVCGFAGYGNVSGGAQEIYDLLPVEEIHPSGLSKQIRSTRNSAKKVYKTVFHEKDIVYPLDSKKRFALHDYYAHPEKYESRFETYLDHLTILVNAIYWDDRYPRLVTKKGLKKLFSGTAPPRLRMISDISCDVEGAIECNLRCTEPGNAVYMFDPMQGSATDGLKGDGVVVLAVDNLPCELPRESSSNFGSHLKQFVPAVVKADYSSDFKRCNLPDPIREAVIVYRGKLTPDFEYLKEYL